MTACALGLRGPGGGIVFMTPSTPGNTSGLFYEAAPTTWSSSVHDPSAVWCDYTNYPLGVTSNRVGRGAMDGAAKTTVMLGVCTSGAANLADSYGTTVNGVQYADWFLPSKGELNQMYIKQSTGVLRGFWSGYYWSSSEAEHREAWIQSFRNGDQGADGKDNAYYVRPVRAF